MGQQIATFAAGCFWGVETRFRAIDGVLDAEVGYTGGSTEKPSYQRVCRGDTGHAEAVRVTFDPDRAAYTDLLDAFWQMHDPTQLNRQGPDRGTQYRSAIFVHDDQQRTAAEASKKALNESGTHTSPVVTTIEPAATFWRAEEYHQQYLEKNGRVCSI